MKPYNEFTDNDLHFLNLEITNNLFDNKINIIGTAYFVSYKKYDEVAEILYTLGKTTAEHLTPTGEPDIIVNISPEFKVAVKLKVENEKGKRVIVNSVLSYLLKHDFITMP